ncbi:MAG: hypothetical protein KGI54_12510 [Pseudomonadota bacterium]|nr:hypothetical protein [Pseudomonadota bacterium]
MSNYQQRVESWMNELSDFHLENLILEYLGSLRPGGRIEQLYQISGFKNIYVNRDFQMFVLGLIIDETINSESIDRGLN